MLASLCPCSKVLTVTSIKMKNILLAAVSAFIAVVSASNEAPHQRDIFYVGGEYVYNATLGGTILTKEQYVEKMTPAQGVHQKYPIVLVHSGGLSGTV